MNFATQQVPGTSTAAEPQLYNAIVANLDELEQVCREVAAVCRAHPDARYVAPPGKATCAYHVGQIAGCESPGCVIGQGVRRAFNASDDTMRLVGRRTLLQTETSCDAKSLFVTPLNHELLWSDADGPLYGNGRRLIDWLQCVQNHQDEGVTLQHALRRANQMFSEVAQEEA